MKLTVSTLATPTWSLDEIVMHFAAAGINGVDFRGIGSEIDITQLPEFTTKLDATLAKLHAAKLEMPCLNTSVRLAVTPDQWTPLLDEAQRYARLAEKTNTPLLRVFGGGVPKEWTRDEGRTAGVRHLRQLVKICKPFGCKPALETHDDWTTVEQVKELVGEFTPDEVAVLWDIQHPFGKGEQPADTVAGLGAYIQHVHIKDAKMNPRGPNTLLGDGDLPIAACVKALNATNFTGWYSLETEKRWQKEAPEPKESVPSFARFMRALE